MKKLILMCLMLMTTIGFVLSGMTLALFHDQESVGTAIFTTGTVSMTSINTFSAQDDLSSNVKYPSWIVQNTGSNGLKLRVKILCEWQDKNPEMTTPMHTVSLLSSAWTLEENGWYLYNKPISANEVLQIDAEIINYDAYWEGRLNVSFEAKATDLLNSE